MTEKKRIMDTKEIAEFLNLKVSHVRSLTYKREIPFLKIGHLVRFDSVEVLNFFKKERKKEEYKIAKAQRKMQENKKPIKIYGGII